MNAAVSVLEARNTAAGQRREVGPNWQPRPRLGTEALHQALWFLSLLALPNMARV